MIMMNRLMAILGVLLLIASCNTGGRDEVMMNDLSLKQEEAIPGARFSGEAQAAQGEASLPVETVRKKIIRDGRMGIKTSDLEAAKARVDSLVKVHGGYYSRESLHNSDFETAWQLNIRIPAAGFEKFIAGVESGKGEILYKEVAARDVTDQFIDLETRLANKQEYLERYRELVKKAANVKEILEIEEKIRMLEEEIESVTGRLKYLGDQVDYSTLDLSITRHKGFKYSPDQRGDFGERLKLSLSKGWHGFVDFLLFLLRLWPFLILAVPTVYFWRRYRRSRGKTRA